MILLSDSVVSCLRCGLCCHYYFDGVLKPCKYLVRLPSGRSLCRVYRRRLGLVLDIDGSGRKIVCVYRRASVYDYVGCPLNSDKPLFMVGGTVSDCVVDGTPSTGGDFDV